MDGDIRYLTSNKDSLCDTISRLLCSVEILGVIKWSDSQLRPTEGRGVHIKCYTQPLQTFVRLLLPITLTSKLILPVG